MSKILLIEDDAGIVLPLSLYIKNWKHELFTCSNWAEAFDCFQEKKPDLILLDINLPNKNWIEICKEIRLKHTTPIIVISARDSEEDKLELFSLWVDDYVAKPFSMRELMARITAVLKRAEMQKKPRNNKVLSFWPLELNAKNHIALLDWVELTLTKTEFSILEYCIKNTNSTIKRESIMKDVMGYDNYIHDRTIDTHMKNIRKKIGEKINIETVRWVWYRFEII